MRPCCTPQIRLLEILLLSMVRKLPGYMSGSKTSIQNCSISVYRQKRMITVSCLRLHHQQVVDFSFALSHLTAPLYMVRRSEEHTSELQSRENLVCRLLLEKQNINIK